MIKQDTLRNKKQVKVTFVQPHDPAQEAVSVVGDFNDWDPNETKLVKRNNGTRSASITVDTGKKYRFRYYCADGTWFNDEAADEYEVSEHGSENCVVLT